MLNALMNGSSLMHLRRVLTLPERDICYIASFKVNGAEGGIQLHGTIMKGDERRKH